MQNLQTAERFIGRNNELKIFTQWLTDPHAPHILYFHDALEEPEKKGGIGKTWLLQKCQGIVRQQCPELAIARIDFFNVGDRNGVTVAEHIVEALQTTFPDWIPKAFLEAIAEYRNVNKPEDTEIAETRSALFKALTTDLQYLDRQFAHGEKALVVFYDTYELIEQNPIIAALRFSQKFPDTYQFEHIYGVIAGRNMLDWTHLNWKGREQEVQTIAIAPFSQKEMIEYTNTEFLLYAIDAHSKQAKALYDRTEGRPILIGLATDVLNKRIVTLEYLTSIPLGDFEPQLVMQINNLEHPLNWIILFMSHAYHRFNRDILNWLLQEADLKRLLQNIQYEELVNNLPTLSFVRKSGSGDDFVLHDEMRRLVNEYCWPINDKDMRYRNAISRSIIAYYSHAMKEEQSQQKRQIYRTERLFHKLFLDINDGLEYFEEHFNRAISLWQSPFARTLWQEAQLFEDKMSPNQRNNLKLNLANLLRAEDDPDEALDIYQALERQAEEQWTSEHRLGLLDGKGRCYLALSRFSEAIDCVTQCLEIEQVKKDDESANARLLGQLGYVHRRRGQFDEAVRYYDESIAIHKRLNNLRAYADMLNSIGFVYKLQGKMDEALRSCKIALRIRNALFKASKVSEVSIGLTLSTMGQIYLDMDDIISAENSFEDAYQIFNRVRHKTAIASMLNRFGQVEMARSNWGKAKNWFEQAQQVSAEIDSEAYINSLNKQGRVLAKQKCWTEAAVFFQQAVDIARKVHDDYQRTESLLDLVEALEYMGQHHQVSQLLHEAEQISLQWNYFHLLGHAAEIQGDIAYADHRYEEAFAYYQEYCYHMARRNTFEFSKALRKLTSQIVDVPTNQLHPIIDSLTAYWYEKEMETIYPDLLNACKELSDSLLI